MQDAAGLHISIVQKLLCLAVSLAWGLRRVAEIILADITTG